MPAARPPRPCPGTRASPSFFIPGSSLLVPAPEIIRSFHMAAVPLANRPSVVTPPSALPSPSFRTFVERVLSHSPVHGHSPFVLAPSPSHHPSLNLDSPKAAEFPLVPRSSAFLSPRPALCLIIPNRFFKQNLVQPPAFMRAGGTTIGCGAMSRLIRSLPRRMEALPP